MGKKSWSSSIPRADGTASTMTASNFKPNFEVPELKVTDSSADDADSYGRKAADTVPSRMQCDFDLAGCHKPTEAANGPPNAVATSVLAMVLDRQVQKLQRTCQNIKSMHLFPIAYLLSSFLPVIMMFVFPLFPQVQLPSQVYAFVRDAFWSAFIMLLINTPGTIAGAAMVKVMLLALMFVPVVIGVGTTVALKLLKGINALNKTLIWSLFVTLAVYLMVNLGVHLFK